MRARDFRHAAGGGMEMRINPGIAFIQPDSQISILPPARRRGGDRLLRRMIGKKSGRRGELKSLLTIRVFAREATILALVSGLANERLEKSWPLKHSMTEQLCVER